MGKALLAKLPQQRVRAPNNHPTIEKLEKLFDFMDDLDIDFDFDIDRIYVIDRSRSNDGRWEIRDIINSSLLTELPCAPGEYKLTRTTDISPRNAQPAPQNPAINPTKASGLNHFKHKQAQKPKVRKTKVPPPTKQQSKQQRQQPNRQRFFIGDIPIDPHDNYIGTAR